MIKFYYSKIIEGEHDLPLPGPWSRRQGGGTRRPGGDVPPQGGGMTHSSGEEKEDRPLSGPWSRRSEEYEPPRGDVPETAAGPEYRGGDQSEDAAAPEPVKTRQRPVPVHRRAEPEAGPPDAAGEQPATVKKETEPCVTPRQEQQCRNVLIRNMLSPSGLYAGIIMSEVLGGRGGRNGRRSSVVGRRY